MLKVGLIGCGHISETYFRSQTYFNNINIVACADINIEAATAKGIVTSWDSATKTVRVNTVVGTFAAPKKVTGETSGAEYDQATVDDQLLPTVPYADNKILETDGDNILDFTELDPWSEGDL